MLCQAIVRALAFRNWTGTGPRSRGRQQGVADDDHGCRITFPVALRLESTFSASAVFASGKVACTCDEILPSAAHWMILLKFALLCSGNFLSKAPQNTPRMSQLLSRREVERNARNGSRRKADHQQPAFPAERAQRRLR